MRRKIFFFLAVLALVLYSATPLLAEASLGGFGVAGAFSSNPDDWHSIVVDLESSALVRIYGKVVSDILPTDIYVGVSENMSSVKTWLGDSEGNYLKTGKDDAYLVIEGQAADAERAMDISVDFVCYKAGEQQILQPIGVPVRGRTQSQDESSAGCDAGFGGAFFAAAAILSIIRSYMRKT